MKQLLLFICLFLAAVCTAQDYEEQWDKVIELESQGLVKSAADAVNVIYRQAKKDNNEPQVIKTFFFRAKYMQVLEEGAQAKIINALKEEKASMGIPGASITESIYADMLDDMYDANRYKINQRTHIDGPLPDDFNTWSAKNFNNEIEAAFKRSIETREALYNVPLKDYEAIVELNPALYKTNRSLYDFLIEKYIDFLHKNSYHSFSYDQEGKQQSLLSDTEVFLAYGIPEDVSGKTSSLIQTYQELERFYTAKKDTLSLQRALLRRLQFFNSRSYSRDFKATYLATLSKYSESWHNSPFIYNAMLARARAYSDLADKKQHPDYNRHALALCETILKNSKYTDCAAEALLLKNSLTDSKATLMAEQYVLPGKPVLCRVSYKNVDSLSIRIYTITHSFFQKKGEDGNFAEYIATHTPVKDTLYILPRMADYFEYTTEIVLPPLKKGIYLIDASAYNEKEKGDHAVFTLQAVQIALLEQDNGNETLYQAVDRESGEPVKKVKAWSATDKGVTNNRGFLSLKVPENNKQATEVWFAYRGDTLTTLNHNYYHTITDEEEEEEIVVETNIYTDRGIYRPGQTVYFKGIVVQKKYSSKSVAKDIFVRVVLEDPSGDELASLRLPVNDFGSFTGEFRLPKNGETGQYGIMVEEDQDYEEEEHPFWDNSNIHFQRGDVYFNVEEYKRPSFEAVFEKITEDVRLNESITAKGKALTFSNAPVSGAKVVYSVQRTLTNRYNYRNANAEPLIITTGEAFTNPDGSFEIMFNAAPDISVNPDQKPLFTYTVTADITDISGETRSAVQAIKAGYHSLELQITGINKAPLDEDYEVILNSTNLNGQFFPVKGTVRVYKINNAQRYYLNRQWQSPEIQTIPKTDFEKWFPYVPYESVSRDSIIREKLVYSSEVDTQALKELKFQNLEKWGQGRYEVVFTASDSIGYTAEATHVFEAVHKGIPSLNKSFDYEITNSKYSKDGYVELNLLTPLPLLFVNVYANTKTGVAYDETLRLKAGSKTIRIPVTKGMSAINIAFDYVWQNQRFSKDFTIQLINEESLEIEAASLTHKFMPGSKETWSFTIKGSDRQQAEILASMYDTSLDDFATLNWYDLPGFYNYAGRRYKNFLHKDTSYAGFNNLKTFYGVYLKEDKFRTFGFNIKESTFDTGRELRQKKQDYTIMQDGGFKVTGIVSDATGPLPGASVIVLDTDRSTSTDIDGKFSIALYKYDVLEISYVGYDTQRLTPSKGEINIILKEGNASELIVKDVYRSTTSKKTTAAMTTLSIVAIEDRANASVLQSLQGQVAGLNIGAGDYPGGNSIILRGTANMDYDKAPLFVIDGIPVDENGYRSINANDLASFTILKDSAATSIYGNRGANGVVVITTKKGLQDEREVLEKVKTRKNFNETAFFYPQLRTDKDGNVSFTFTAPEALTEWKLRLFAHNKKAEFGYFAHTAITQKDLMIVPNMPRFLREKDTIVIVAKITNLTPQAMAGNAMLQLFDAATMQPVDAQMLNSESMKPFTIAAKGNTTASWTITVPQGLQGVQYRVAAKTGSFTDGEENILPVLTNSMLVTESIPLWVKPNTTKEYTLENLKNNTSSTLRHQGITLEYTSNPTWLALQSLPYLMEFEHECAEQVFSRYYANAIATHVLNSNPKVAEVFASWRAAGKPISKLAQNEELKSIIMAESPWLLDTESEQEKKNRLALLFDLDKMKMGLALNLGKLEDKQSASGGFPWFEGGKDNEYITRHIIAGFGHLKKLGIVPEGNYTADILTKKGVAFIDARFLENYHKMEAKAKADKKPLIIKDPVSGLHYLYARSFYHEQYKPDDSLNTAIEKYLAEIKHDWLDYPLYEKGMAALTLQRFGDTITSGKIIRSLKETSSNNEEWGMYWKENTPGWRWYRAPIETQALLIEAFAEVGKDTVAADAMKVWLIKQKQNKHWPTTKSTTEAVYALIMQGTNWLSVKDATSITYGDPETFGKKLAQTDNEAETGYLKMQWKPEEVTKDLATLKIENKNSVPGYGGLYWQYFEELDKIPSAQKGLMNVEKELYVKTTTANGPGLRKLSAGVPLKIGELVTVRLVLNIKEDVEYVHLKDLRASAFEPVDVLSGYNYRDGLGYYHSTRDAATHFFFDNIKRGTYVLEYDIRVNNAGTFSNGITTIESMYAPEFSGHTKGIRVMAE